MLYQYHQMGNDMKSLERAVAWLAEALCYKPEGPDGVIEFFPNLPNPSSRTRALGFTQLLTEMSTRKW
jgi:hypothetical protein